MPESFLGSKQICELGKNFAKEVPPSPVLMQVGSNIPSWSQSCISRETATLSQKILGVSQPAITAKSGLRLIDRSQGYVIKAGT